MSRGLPRFGVKRLGGVACALAAAAALMLALAVMAHGYAKEGCYWPTIQRAGAFGWNDAASDSDSHNAFIAAKNAWNNTPTKIYLSGSGAGITTDSQNYGNTGYDGITHYSCTNGVFNNGVTANLNTYYTASYAGTERQSVAAHEFGHALGLAHSGSLTCGSVPLMYYSTSRWTACGVYTPQSDDINGINAIYGAP